MSGRLRRIARFGPAATMLAGLALGAAPPAAAEPDAAAPGAAGGFAEPLPAEALEATYEVYSGGFQALTLVLRYDGAAGERYAARLRARSDGFLANFFTFRLESEAEGRRTAAGPAPRRFRTEARWADNSPRRVALTYRDDGRIETEVVPPPEADARRPVPEAARRGTLDPVSAVVKLLEASTAAGRCAGEARIFDGRRRLDIAAEPLGQAEIEPSGYTVYAGPAQLCRVALEPITGFWDGEERRERYPSELRVFLAEVAEGQPALPVRVEMDLIARGAVRAHLTDLRVGRQAAAR